MNRPRYSAKQPRCSSHSALRCSLHPALCCGRELVGVRRRGDLATVSPRLRETSRFGGKSSFRPGRTAVRPPWFLVTWCIFCLFCALDLPVLLARADARALRASSDALSLAWPVETRSGAADFCRNSLDGCADALLEGAAYSWPRLLANDSRNRSNLLCTREPRESDKESSCSSDSL